MDSPFIIPLAAFAMTALIVAIITLAKIRDKEMDVHQKLHTEELDHQRRMKELDLELAKVRQGGSSAA